MDAQLGVGPELDNEWVVDKIISHTSDEIAKSHNSSQLRSYTNYYNC